jgi:hypothetical protein
MKNLLSLLLMLELIEKGLTQSSANARENHKQKQKHIGDMLKLCSFVPLFPVFKHCLE